MFQNNTLKYNIEIAIVPSTIKYKVAVGFASNLVFFILNLTFKALSQKS
jgi:hypothetical protein